MSCNTLPTLAEMEAQILAMHGNLDDLFNKIISLLNDVIRLITQFHIVHRDQNFKSKLTDQMIYRTCSELSGIAHALNSYFRPQIAEVWR